MRRTLDAIHSWDEWPDRWVETGERYETLGDEALKRGRDVTAGSHLRRAALTYHFAQFTLTQDLGKREAIHRRSARVYRAAAPLLHPQAEPVEIAWEGAILRGYLRKPADAKSTPLVVLIPGLESTKEQFTTFEPYLLERGIATLSFEGPGQGETWYERGFDDDDYLGATEALKTFIKSLPGIDRLRLAVLGTSFGGYLALRTAPVLEPVAVVDIAGPYDLADLDSLQPVIRENLAHFMKLPQAKLAGRSGAISLHSVLPISAEVLIVHGERDNIIPVENARRIAGRQPHAETWIHPDGNHSCNNLHTIVRPAIGDWLSDRLGASA